MAVFFILPVLLTFLAYTVECATTIQIERIPHLNLDDGIEHAIRLTKGQHSVFYFHFTERKLPLFMHVTPCGAQVYWRLYAPNHQEFQPLNVYPYSNQFNDLSHRIPPLVNFPHHAENDRMVLLGGQADERRMHYFNHAIDADFVMLNLSAVEDTTVRVFMTTSQTLLEKQYPPLPRNNLMEHDIYNDHDHFLLYNIRFRWHIPQVIQKMNDLKQTLMRYKYCILLTKSPLYTMCPGKNVINEAEYCVNQTTSETVVKKLKSRGQLYATLFIRDAFSQSTSALRPIEIKLPIDPIDEEINIRKRLIRKEDESTINQLHDGLVDEWVMPPIRHDIRNYEFIVPKMAAPVHVQVVVRVCAGSIEIRIDKNGRRIKTFSHVSGSTRRFVILNNNDETINIQILNHRNKPSGFDIWASTHPELNPFPQLPDDANLHAQSGKCNSADLQFYRVPDVHVAYCLYMERVNFQSLVHKTAVNASEQCWPSRPPGELVTCFEEDRDADTERAKEELIHMTVPDLKPDTTYRFILTVISMGKPYPRELKYKSQSVRTAAIC